MNTFLHIFALPLSWLYSIAVWLRNMLYEERILPSTSVSVPTICVGNLAVGGTGKTPMTEYLIRLLGEKYKVAVLSRGYGRETTGFRMAGPMDTANTIGDEPMLIHMHFPQVPVAVCANRVEGIKRLMHLHPEVQCVILDDAYQHRRLRCGYYILLTAYDNLYVNDHMMPRGRLRDLASESRRANSVIVTKCPESLQPIAKRIVSNQLRLASYQQLCYSSIEYAEVHISGKPLLVTGIANPQPLYGYIKSQHTEADLLAYADHHVYSKRDVQRILRLAENYDHVVTTEKDYVRMQLTPLVETLGDKLIVVAMKTDLGGDKESFDRSVLLYVDENNRKMMNRYQVK